MIESMQSMLAFGWPGGWEWIIVLVVAVLIFGRRLPEIARGVGKSVTEFKKGIKEAESEVTSAVDEASKDVVDEKSLHSADSDISEPENQD